MSAPETPVQRSERIAAELRATTAEAAGVLKDLHAAIKTARAHVEDFAEASVADMIVQATKLIRNIASEEGARINTILTEQIREGCTRATEHITRDWQLAAVIEQVAHKTIAELHALGYAFTQPHDE